MARTGGRSGLARVLASRRVFKGRLVRLRCDRVVLPNGVCTTREVVEYPGSVGIVPLLGHGQVILIRQYRYSVGGYLWEIPAGTLEPGEAPRAAARRELREETGYTAGRLVLLAKLFTSPGILTEQMRLYLGTELKPSRLPCDLDECIEVRPFAFRDALRMIRSGALRDGKTLLGLTLLAREHPELLRR
jgi:ADP-ribose pyrophosphatase